MVNGHMHPVLGAQGTARPLPVGNCALADPRAVVKSRYFHKAGRKPEGSCHLKGTRRGRRAVPGWPLWVPPALRAVHWGSPRGSHPGAKASEEEQECSAATGAGASHPSLGSRQPREVHTQRYSKSPRG